MLTLEQVRNAVVATDPMRNFTANELEHIAVNVYEFMRDNNRNSFAEVADGELYPVIKERYRNAHR